MAHDFLSGDMFPPNGDVRIRCLIGDGDRPPSEPAMPVVFLTDPAHQSPLKISVNAEAIMWVITTITPISMNNTQANRKNSKTAIMLTSPCDDDVDADQERHCADHLHFYVHHFTPLMAA